MAADRPITPSKPNRPKDDPDKPRIIVIAAANNSLDSHICTQLTYTDTRNGWMLIQRPFPWSGEPLFVDGRQPDGCLAWATHEAEAESVRRLGIPVVNMSSGLDQSGLPTVTNDNLEVGRIAARHLLHDCAMPQLGFVNLSPQRYAWSRRRCEGFREVAQQAGLDCHELVRLMRPGVQCAKPDPALEQWLATLPKPIGVLGVDDWSAIAVIRACHRIGLEVPHDVAVIGANNDLICSMTSPSVTSVDRNQARVVLEATTLLEELMNGASPKPANVYLPPLGVVKRDSTNTLAVGDPTIAAVVEYVRANIEEPFNIKMLAKRFGVSSKTLARGFSHWLHCRPADYVLRLRLARARELLREPHKLSIVAKVSGFSDEKQLRTAFKRAMGMSPQDYRRHVMTNASITR